MSKSIKLKAGHYEIIGETIAKFELFENNWNPYSRYLDIDKVDIVLRRRHNTEIVYREIQVKYGKLFKCKTKWEMEIFDFTSWRFFNPDEFKNELSNNTLFLLYVLVPESGYQGDLFIFPIQKFNDLINDSIVSNTKKGEKRKLYISRDKDDENKWYVRKNGFAKQNSSLSSMCIDISSYRRNFEILD